ncbi:MAG: amidohydrolase, partial [Vicinamibacterales bacterium]
MKTPLVVLGLVGMVAVVGAQQNSRPTPVPVRRPVAPPKPVTIDVTVHEGTSMSVAISPDGNTIATDMQGSIWTMPAAGGAMTRITDVFNDARQPMWSPDGRTIAFFGYRDGGYDIWAINPDGTNQRKLTSGTFDDREPIFSHDGTRIAFSSDRGNMLGSDYNIWTLDLRNGELKQITKGPSEDFMPSWSPDDSEIAFASSRDNYESLWAMNVRSMGDRRLRSIKGARLDAPSWGPGGQLIYHVTEGGQSRFEIDGKSVTGSENVFAFRASWASRTDYVYVSDGKIRRRSVTGLPVQTVEFTATMPVTHPEYTHRV